MLNCDRRGERIFARGRTETKEAEILMMLRRGIDFFGFSGRCVIGQAYGDERRYLWRYASYTPDTLYLNQSIRGETKRSINFFRPTCNDLSLQLFHRLL